MNQLRSAALMVGAALGLSPVSGEAGPCTESIAAFERAVRQSASNPTLGATAPQTIDAQLHRQPTPSTVMQAMDRAQRAFEAILARAKMLDDEGKRAECAQALEDARMIFETK
jgi:hypothetical protein